MLKYLLNILFAATVVSLAAQNKQKVTFKEWDMNRDNMISRSEFFNEFTEKYYGSWDMDDNNYLQNDEFYKKTYTFWDVDQDGVLDDTEWYRAFDYFFGDHVMIDFNAADFNDNGQVGYDEYFDMLENTDFYVSFDVNNDGVLKEFELARGIFNYWDLDNSRFIEYDEYTKFDNTYLTL